MIRSTLTVATGVGVVVLVGVATGLTVAAVEAGSFVVRVARDHLRALNDRPSTRVVRVGSHRVVVVEQAPEPRPVFSDPVREEMEREVEQVRALPVLVFDPADWIVG